MDINYISICLTTPTSKDLKGLLEAGPIFTDKGEKRHCTRKAVKRPNSVTTCKNFRIVQKLHKTNINYGQRGRLLPKIKSFQKIDFVMGVVCSFFRSCSHGYA
jgi:hypothetical protein